MVYRNAHRDVKKFTSSIILYYVLKYLLETLIQMQRTERNVPESQVKRIANISALIRNLRINENLSRNDFAKLAEAHPNSIYNIEHQKVDIITLLKCIDGTGLTLQQFFECVEEE